MVFRKPGGGRFGGWTRDERQPYIDQARRALAMLGIKRVPYRRLPPHGEPEPARRLPASNTLSTPEPGQT
jgi:hypothetical protein